MTSELMTSAILRYLLIPLKKEKKILVISIDEFRQFLIGQVRSLRLLAVIVITKGIKPDSY